MAAQNYSDLYAHEILPAADIVGEIAWSSSNPAGDLIQCDFCGEYYEHEEENSEAGECDTCGDAYDPGDSSGRCGDCGNCGACCTHERPVIA
jgi:hypothetical protein